MQDVFYGAYLDHGGADYTCGFKWYAGHAGVDILLRNFTEQDSGVAVLAAASGTVYIVQDGMFDRSTINGNGGFGNYVAIEHAGGPVSYYGHMRRGSIRVQPDAVVARGDTLGLVGSAGNSNWPHLHFEVRQSRTGAPVDPFLGSCNPPVSQPTWIDQVPWQGQVAVLDAGITTVGLSFADLLERPPDVAVVKAQDGQVVFWASLYNIRASATRIAVLDDGGTVLGQTGTGAFTTYSTRFLVAGFSLAAMNLTAGSNTIVLWATLENGAGEAELARRTFTYDPGVIPAPRPAPGAPGGGRHTTYVTGQAGDGPPVPRRPY